MKQFDGAWKSAVVMLAATAVASMGEALAARTETTPAQLTPAVFNRDGTVVLPDGYRHWEHIGTRYKPAATTNILDGQLTKTPEVLNAYVEPGAFAAFRITGKWPDGTQIVKEFSAIRTGPGCDATTAICTTPLGTGLFETGYIGLGMMVKDSKRFPRAQGNWGYFNFGHKTPPYDPTATIEPYAQCAECHARLAADSDYVVTVAHIGLGVTGAH